MKKNEGRIEGRNIVEPNRKTNIVFRGHANQKFEVELRTETKMLKKLLVYIVGV